MKYIHIAAPVLLGALLLAACGSAPTPPDVAKLGQVIYARPAQGVPATAVFVRDLSFSGMGKTVHVYVDGEHAAELETSEKAPIELTAGNHMFGVEIGPLTGQATSFVEERLEPGQSYVYRIGSDASGGIQIQRSR